MKSLTFQIAGNEMTTDKAPILDAATVKTENDQTLVNFAKNPAIAAQLIQYGLRPANDNPRKAIMPKDYWFVVKVNE